MSVAKQKKHTLKIVVIGDAGVGKTCLMQRYMTGNFSADYRTTVGADFLSTKITVEEVTYTLQIWDTAGQEKFQAIGAAFYRGSDCCIVVFDLSNRRSFENVSTWINEFTLQGEIPNPEKFPFVIIGNKCDKPDRQVTTEEAKEFFHSKELGYFETSAKEDIGISEAFKFITEQTIAKTSKNETIPIPGGVVTLTKHKSPQKENPECGC